MIHAKMTLKWGIMGHLDQLLPQLIIGRYHNRPSTIPSQTANQTIPQNKLIDIFTYSSKPTCPLRTCRSSLCLPQLAQYIICNLSLNINHLSDDCPLLIASMLHSTASGHQIRVAAKCISNNITFAQYLDKFNVKLATKVQCTNLALQQ